MSDYVSNESSSNLFELMSDRGFALCGFTQLSTDDELIYCEPTSKARDTRIFFFIPNRAFIVMICHHEFETGGRMKEYLFARIWYKRVDEQVPDSESKFYESGTTLEEVATSAKERADAMLPYLDTLPFHRLDVEDFVPHEEFPGCDRTFWKKLRGSMPGHRYLDSLLSEPLILRGNSLAQ